MNARRLFRQDHGSRGGYTLIEMAVSCAIVAVLMLAIGSAMQLTLVTTGDMAESAAQDGETAYAADQVGSDLNLAMNFTERTAMEVTFTVPDRQVAGDADRGPDTVRYAWWPTGAPANLTATPAVPAIPALTLTRQYNGGPVSVFARDVRDFRLDYLTRMAAAQTLGPAADRLFLSHDPVGGTSREHFPTNSAWAAQVFRVNTTSTAWRATRIRLFCKTDGNPDGYVRVQFRTANALTNVPGPTVLEEVEVPEIAFDDAYGFVDVKFNNLGSLSPTAKYAIVLIGASPSGSASSYGWVQSGGATANTYFTTTNSNGVLWTLPTGSSSMRYYLYGSSE